jgi:hypothetical protein
VACHLFGTRYLDRLERRAGAWRLSHRLVKIDFVQIVEEGAGPGGKLASLPFLGQASPNHPDYRRLASP